MRRRESERDAGGQKQDSSKTTENNVKNCKISDF
jgi:hypothetical protein